MYVPVNTILKIIINSVKYNIAFFTPKAAISGYFSNFVIEYLKISPDNLRSFKLFFNDSEVVREIKTVKEKDKEEGGLFYDFDEFQIGDRYLILNIETKNGDEFKISSLKRKLAGIDSEFEFFGYDKSIILDDRKDYDYEEDKLMGMTCEKE